MDAVSVRSPSAAEVAKTCVGAATFSIWGSTEADRRATLETLQQDALDLLDRMLL